MANYKCKTSFTAKSGKYYSYGTKIDSHEYYNLDSSDRNNFREVDDSGYPNHDNPTMNIAMGDMLGTKIPGGVDGDMSTLL